MLEELTNTKNQVNQLYFDNRKNIQLIATTKAQNDELTTKLTTLSKKHTFEMVKLLKTHQNLEAQVACLSKEKEEQLKQIKQLAENNKHLARANKHLSAQLSQLKFGISQQEADNQVNNSNVYEVDKILDDRIYRKQRQFLITLVNKFN